MRVEEISRFAVEAMLSEVSATPKPGLVDRNNAGAHRDMDFFTFVQSSASIAHGLYRMTAVGRAFRGLPIKQMWEELKSVGYETEQAMFQATKGVNTHKGMIFSLGILAAVAAQLEGKLSAQRICEGASQLCQGLCDEAYGHLSDRSTWTKGERMYMLYGMRGARGEAEDGFPTVLQISLPTYRSLREQGVSVNDGLVETLLHLIAHTEDTNIISRHNREMALYAKEAARAVLSQGGIHTELGLQAIYALDEAFIDRYISPGGAADLLALTHFLYEIERLQ